MICWSFYAYRLHIKNWSSLLGSLFAGIHSSSWTYRCCTLLSSVDNILVSSSTRLRCKNFMLSGAFGKVLKDIILTVFCSALVLLQFSGSMPLLLYYHNQNRSIWKSVFWKTILQTFYHKRGKKSFGIKVMPIQQSRTSMCLSKCHIGSRKVSVVFTLNNLMSNPSHNVSLKYDSVFYCTENKGLFLILSHPL